ncbi:3-phosphoglycerate dehydrogenase [Nitrosopumilus sp. b1]|uniref:D-2-hydroxyacid dehydrogenase n=1 Tax=Nitrosopumilus sp. b1 TaxID=2109907 RepID=UPI000E2C0349|nr:D-2-hydroxyacid dehydrogenase [Nitrosopumilus sp. b1]RDJ32559.1 MAG: 3-phosphoglycerate dehydrogenase [Thermoproteota archaeon]KAF6243689.1 3-phosphoglycerate dehydrogenase [Nitrosopumilus sp. b1]RDJ32948.1 MAG: 3-phosphoglycerate dehydrogenase [Thermoproteota archaeon]RDJ35971.1 MAG: 3-phosphoglycerate dehydrogenase [Thermoproteota archaeon]RDJ38216.1 MAG: 3-phosphoglycerate dehydrogenase [Thermoproteota archaeon]
MSFNDSVLICDEVDKVLEKILKENGLQVTYEPEITPEQIKEKISQFNIVIVRSRTKITKEMIDKAEKCKIIARVGVGLDNIDLDAAKAKNIRVINAVEGAMTAVAELVLGLMFSLARQIPRADRGIRNDQWLKKQMLGTELKGKYLGIVGLGNIGKRLGRLARGLNMNIIGYDVVPIDEEFAKDVGLMKADLDTLLQSSDYISLHVPLLDSTYHLIDAKRLSTMKKTAKIINTSRGGVIDEDALYEALKNGNLGGAALDVFEKEPATGHKLASLDNVILTPHMGAQTKEAQSLAANVIAEKIIQILRGVI